MQASLNYLKAAEKFWVIRGLRLVPKPLQRRLPALAVIVVALAVARALAPL